MTTTGASGEEIRESKLQHRLAYIAAVAAIAAAVISLIGVWMQRDADKDASVREERRDAYVQYLSAAYDSVSNGYFLSFCGEPETAPNADQTYDQQQDDLQAAFFGALIVASDDVAQKLEAANTAWGEVYSLHDTTLPRHQESCVDYKTTDASAVVNEYYSNVLEVLDTARGELGYGSIAFDQ